MCPYNIGREQEQTVQQDIDTEARIYNIVVKESDREAPRVS
jgi:hypothetical protein